MSGFGEDHYAYTHLDDLLYLLQALWSCKIFFVRILLLIACVYHLGESWPARKCAQAGIARSLPVAFLIALFSDLVFVGYTLTSWTDHWYCPFSLHVTGNWLFTSCIALIYACAAQLLACRIFDIGQGAAGFDNLKCI